MSEKKVIKKNPTGGVNLRPPCTIGLKENMRAEELSQGRTGTCSHYELTWIKWDSRYNRRSLDSFRRDVNPILV